MRREYLSEWKQVRLYWEEYGGFRALVHSPYTHASLVLAALCFPIWQQRGWWDTVLNTIPNILGFSLAGFAVLIGFGSEKFREFIAGNHPGEVGSSPFVAFATTFMHFIVVQLAALCVALLAKAELLSRLALSGRPESFLTIVRVTFWGLSFALFIYALLVILATAFAIMRLVRSYDEFRTKQIEAAQSE